MPINQNIFMFWLMNLYLHNVRTRNKELFEPINPERVTMYVCGPTVYGPAHIGNARPAVVFDTLARLLRTIYGADRLVYARNITDVDDKINQKAQDEAVDISVITDRYKAQYHENMGKLGVAIPDIEPHATAHIAEMISMIEALIAKGFAYEAEGHVLFDVTKDPDYGSLSGRNRDDMIAGARVEVAPYKRDPADFVLWKPSPNDLPGWESPFRNTGGENNGRGRPGWHIECSAMIKKHLGETIDIHGGGQDLQFPHHENECAQSRCLHDAPLANFWLHNGMLNMSGKKMSKSLGNIRRVDELLADAPAEAIRLALLQGHYRQPLDFTPDLLKQSVKNLDRLYGALRDAPDIEVEQVGAPHAFLEAFLAALCDDLNTPKALAELFVLAKKANTAKGKGALQAAGKMLGLLQQDPADWFAGDVGTRSDVDIASAIEAVEALIAERAQARAAKDFVRADAVRDKLSDMGIVIEDNADGTDGAHGTTWRRAR